MDRSKVGLCLVLSIFILVITGCSEALDVAESAPKVEAVPQAVSDESGVQTGEQVLESAVDPESQPIDEFFDESFKRILMRDPELITSEGMADYMRVRNDQLTNISDEYIRENYEIYAEIQAALHAYDRQALTPDEQVSYDVYDWYLDDLLRQQEFMYHDYPVSHFFVTSVPDSLFQLLTEYHPITDQQDVEDYLSRLSQVDEKFDQLIEGLELRKQAGIVVPKFALQQAMGNIRGLANSTASSMPYYSALQEKMQLLSSITPEDQESFLELAETEIESGVLPAYQALEAYLAELIEGAPNKIGLQQYEGGTEYYAHLLRHFTTTDMTPDEIHELGYQELARVQAEMRIIFDELGYPENENLEDSFQRVVQESGMLTGSEILAEYEAILEQAEGKLDVVFDVSPEAELIVVGGPTGGYYVSPALDGSRPGAFHAATSGSETIYTMPTLAYHEGVPGHHFQIALAREFDLPLFRNAASFLGYVEGWALYAEHLAAELGWYEDDPYGDLGRLQFEAWRAARLIVDTGIHTKGWSYNKAADFLAENTGLGSGWMNYEVGRYAVWPGQATSYMVGMLKILELREMAMEALGDQFDLKEFHNVVLRNGSMPLEILERVVEDYIDAK